MHVRLLKELLVVTNVKVAENGQIAVDIEAAE